MVVAVDGPAAAGKTTTCLALADTFGLKYLESGRTYRLLAFEALRRSISVDDESAVVSLCEELIKSNRTTGLLEVDRHDVGDLRSGAVNIAVSAVAKFPELRRRVTELVRVWAGAQGGCVVEGRDIGTVVFPAAPIKFYLTATPEARAARRVVQERAGSYEDVLRDVVRRDEADMSRAASPLVPADDAVVIDTTDLAVHQVVDLMTSLCRRCGVAIP
ncbi:(d)CMP kinase [Actinosynnema sp. NPDC050801]|uniref:(d)CMP kinase n=1 Tax=unclassified Actinosynnema TaxID=2637065 RepID=UPI0033CA4E1B